MSRANVLAVVAGICLAVSGCGFDRTAGGTGSETTNTVRVSVLDRAGRPVAGARVFARSENDIGSDGAAPVTTISDGTAEVAAVPGRTWIEARSGDSVAAMDVLPANPGARSTLMLAATTALRVSGLAPGQIVSLPGLGRSEVAGPDGVARFGGLPTGAARARWSGYDGPAPLPKSDTGLMVATDSGTRVAWPSDGSLDSQVVRRFLDQCGLEKVPTGSVAKAIEGRLAHLDLSGQDLDSIPASVGSLGFLRELVLRRNRLHSLPASFGALRLLDVLDLGANPLDSVPEAVRRIDSLRILEVDSAGLRALPSWVGNLRKLWYLGVGWNKLDSLPTSISSLKRLAILGVYQNRISSLPFGMEGMDSLDQLWAETNRIRSLPESFSRNPSLRIVQLDNNPLDSLPSDFGSLQALRDLRLTGTGLHALPASLANLPLERLDVQGLSLCSIDPVLEPKLDSLAGAEWRSLRASGCP